MPLTPWDSNSVFISLYVATGLVKNANAESLLLVGPPGSGKSELLRRFTEEPSCMVVGDMTIDPLRDLLSDEERAHSLRHLVMPEFGRLFSHRDHTVSMVTSLLTSVMTRDAGREMVGSVKDGRRIDFTGKQLGVLGAMPDDIFRLRYKDLLSTGFLSRFTLLGIGRSREEKARVMHNIAHRIKTDLRPFRCGLPAKPVEISGGDRFGQQLLDWVYEWNPNAGERLLGHIINLLPAMALLRNRRAVTQSDVDALKLFQGYFQSISTDGLIKLNVLTPLPTYSEFCAISSPRKKRRA